MAHAITIALVLASALSLGAEEMVDIEVVLPKPHFAGTPYDGPVPKNFDIKGSFRRPPSVRAPDGAVNVAIAKPVSASVQPTTGELGFITDGDKSQREPKFVELPAGRQWVQIDLGEAYDLYGIALWRWYEGDRFYFEMIVQVSSDPKFRDDVRTVYNTDSANEAGLGVGKDDMYFETYRGRVILIPDPINGRYVRLYSHGNTANEMNHYMEVEVYGVPSKRASVE